MKTESKRFWKWSVGILSVLLLMSMVSFPVMEAFADTGYSRDRFGDQIQINTSKNGDRGSVTWSCTGATVSVGVSQGASLGFQLAFYKVSSVSVTVTYRVAGVPKSQYYYGSYGSYPRGYTSGSFTLPGGATNIAVTCQATFKATPPAFGVIAYIFYWFYPSSTFSATSYYS
jgi:hypothetical protein